MAKIQPLRVYCLMLIRVLHGQRAISKTHTETIAGRNKEIQISPIRNYKLIEPQFWESWICEHRTHWN